MAASFFKSYSMKGLSKARHQKLQSSLSHLEVLMQIKQQNFEQLKIVQGLRRDLETSYRRYEDLLTQIALEVDLYEKERNRAARQVVCDQIRKLKLILEPDDPEYLHLLQSIEGLFSS